MKDTNYIRVYLYCKVKKAIFVLIATLFLFISNALMAETISIATQNAYNFYNNKNDGKHEKVLSTKNYVLRLNRMSKHIVQSLKSPDIIALQEIENYSTLNDLKKKLKQQYNLCYQVILLNGHQRVAINVAYLVSCSLDITNVSQLFKDTLLKHSKKQLYTRPPLYLNVCKAEQCLHLVNVHLRSMIGLNRKKKRKYVAQKRLQQSEQLAQWINQFQTQWPQEKLIVLGDFNALKLSDRYVDVLGIIKGSPARFNEKYASSDLVQRNLFDLSLKVPIEQRFSYRYKKKHQMLDYVLISQNLVPFADLISFTNINYKVSDHAGLITQFSFK